MNITKLLVVVFIAALCHNVGASQLRGMPNDTKLMDQKLQPEGIGDIIRDIFNIIIGILGNNTRPINTTIPTSPNNTSPAPSPEGGLVEIDPSLAPQGEATNGIKAPLSGGIIGVPSLAPEGEASSGTEAPLNGGIIGVSPSPLSGGIIEAAPSPIGTEAPLSGGDIGIAPSLLPIGGGTEPPLSGGILEFSPPPVPLGGANTDTEAPLSGGAIGVPPSLLPIGDGTEPPQSGGVAPSLLPIGGGIQPPLSGGIIELSPPPVPQGGVTIQAPLIGGVIGDAPATNNMGAPLVVNIGVTHVSTEERIVFTTNNFGSEDGSNGGSGTEP